MTGDALPASATRLSFVQELPSTRVVFGRGSAADLLPEVERLGLERIVVIADAGAAEVAPDLIAPLGGRVAASFDGVRPHVPAEVATRARELAADARADGLLAIGGGSTTGTAKAVALTSRLPVLAVPTTYAGSEMTPVWGITSGSTKRTGRSLDVLPRTVVYDPGLLDGLPARLAATSSLNAMAHCVEALSAPASSPLIRIVALEGVKALREGLDKMAAGATRRPDELLYGAHLAGTAFGVAGSGLHHKICHVLGGRFDLAHAELHAAILPAVIEFNAPALPARMADLAASLAAADAGVGLRALYDRLRLTPTLESAGLHPADFEAAVDAVAGVLPLDNVRAVSRADVRAILESAFAGRRRT
ncbi:maleylacetate reductase [Spongiactinospora sp. 9N601]|uniref:maleylacetate reductase n=1 Tax=Spongiactinospora sp. 9N601 TaxID=3375149 RepID=UPI0037B58FF2